jgi:glycosyltransferase involved in cell wall biosynthesis
MISVPQPVALNREVAATPLRICLVTETYFPQLNGVSRTLSQLVRHLMNQGEEILIVHPDYKEDGLGPGRLPVRAIRPPFYRDLHVPLPPFGRVWREVERFGPDLVHIATEASLGLSALRWSHRSGVPVVSSFHTNFDQYTEHYRLGWGRGLIWRYLRWFHNRTVETYVPSRTTISELERRGFERLILWPRGVDSGLFSPDRPGRHRVRQALGLAPSDILVGHVGRLAAEKNIDYLAASLRLVLEGNERARVLIVGDGPARGTLEEALGPRACFVGFRTGDDLADHYAAADLFAFASTTETFGNVVLEAMASGLPVVAVRSGGPVGIIRDGETGFLIGPSEEPASHARALLRLIADEPLRRRVAIAGRRHAESQNWAVVMAKLHARYRAISGKGEAGVSSLVAGARPER